MDAFHITNKGLSYLSKAAAGQIMLFTKGKFGDGTFTGATPVEELAALINPLGDMPISNKAVSGKVVTVTTQFSNNVSGSLLPAFYLKEIGLYAKMQTAEGVDDTENPEALVAYAYVTGEDQGDRIPDVLTEFIINWPLTVSNAANVSVEVSSLAYAKQVDLIALQNIVDGKAEQTDLIALQNIVDGKAEFEEYSGDLNYVYPDGDNPRILNITADATNKPESEERGLLIVCMYTNGVELQYFFGSDNLYWRKSSSGAPAGAWLDWETVGNTTPFANITKNPDDTTGDIISTHLTIGTRATDETYGTYSFTNGEDNSAKGEDSAVIGGYNNEASADESVVIGGGHNTASGINSVVISGVNNTALANQVKAGHYSKDGTAGTASGTTGDALIIGNGTSDATANCFRVGYDGYVYGGKTFAANAADVAELYEWQDGNTNKEDRRGLFVTLDGEKIKLASPTDDVIGVVSALPCLVGDSYSDNWQGMYLKDVFGVPLKQTVHHEAEYREIEEKDPETGEITTKTVYIPAYDAEEYIINPDYDPEQEYIPREQRPEYDYVTDWGKVVLVDDGTCEVNGYATVGENGKATNADERTLIRVMKRIDDTHIYVSIKNRLI